MYFIITENSFFALKEPESSTSSISDFGFKKKPTNIQVANATIGIKILLLMKSNRSRNCIPSTLNSAQTLYPSDEGRPNTRQIPKTIRQDTVLLSFSLSINTATIVSGNNVSFCRVTEKDTCVFATTRIFLLKN